MLRIHTAWNLKVLRTDIVVCCYDIIVCCYDIVVCCYDIVVCCYDIVVSCYDIFVSSYAHVSAAILVDPRHDRAVRPEVHARAKACLARHMTAIGFKSEKQLPETMYQMCTVYFGRDDAACVELFLSFCG